MSKLKPFVLVTILFLSISTPISAYFVANITGTHVTISEGQVLGDDDEKEESKQEDSKPEEKREEQKREEKQEQRTEQRQEQEKVERKIETKNKQQEIKKENAKIQNKLNIIKKNTSVLIDPSTKTLSVSQNTPENQKRLKELEGKRLELENELTKQTDSQNQVQKEQILKELKEVNTQSKKLSPRVIKEVKDDDLEVTSDDGMVLRTTRTRIQSKETENENETEREVEISKDDARIRTTLPVGIDANTNNLIIQSPKQDIEVEKTPEIVLDALRSKDIIDDFSINEQDLTESQLTLEDNKPIYEIRGEKSKRLFGVIPVKINKGLKVSAETGEVLSTDQSGISKLLELLSL